MEFTRPSLLQHQGHRDVADDTCHPEAWLGGCHLDFIRCFSVRSVWQGVSKIVGLRCQ
jgi:hypothetical protein